MNTPTETRLWSHPQEFHLRHFADVAIPHEAFERLDGAWLLSNLDDAVTGAAADLVTYCQRRVAA
jgi:hypothetical protein